MTTLQEAAQQALDVLETTISSHGDIARSAINALRAALEQPEENWEAVAADQAMTIALLKSEQEPVAWVVYTQDGKSVCVTDNPVDFIEWRSFPLFTHPPRREWRGLTEEEITDGREQLPTEDLCGWSFRQGVEFAEAALKERNA